MSIFANYKRSSLPGLTIWLVLVLALLFSGTMKRICAAENGSVQIKVDQVGYLPDASKIALVTAAARTFEVKRALDGVAVFKGNLGTAHVDADTGDSVQIADFTKLQAPGAYYLEVDGVGRSWNFAIRSDAFVHTYYLAMRAFYGQRCGTAVDLGPEFPGYKYAACHLKGEFHSVIGETGRAG